MTLWYLLLALSVTSASGTSSNHHGHRNLVRRADCPAGYVAYKDTCHFFGVSYVKVNFFEAQVACKAVRGRLVSLDDQDESKYFKDMLSRTYGNADIWIGANYLAKSSHRWVHSNEPLTFTDWAAGEPSYTDDNEMCVEMDGSKSYQWNDIVCNGVRNYVCESP